MLRGALALLGLGAAARIVPTSLLNKMPHTDGGDFVIINGWVLPARYFRG
jgi:predicted RNA-binding protein with PUA domain